MRRAQTASPRVSVVMPVHNGERWLRAAVASVLDQSELSLELILIDDGSADRTAPLMSDFAAADGRVRIVRQEHCGLAAALNLGLAAAKAPLVARLDSDDVSHRERLKVQADWLDSHPSVGLVGTWATEIDARGRVVGVRTPAVDAVALRTVLRRGNPFVHSSIMARTSVLRGIGGYRAAFEAAEDYDLWLRTAETSEIAILPEFLVSYRLHPGGVSARERLRQAFSVRLAQRAAEARRLRVSDPADALEGPPDWSGAMAANTFYADDAALYRWLDPSDVSAAGARPAGGRSLIERLPELSHAERRLAAHALIARIRSADRSDSGAARELLLRLCRERPRAVLSAAWSLRA